MGKFGLWMVIVCLLVVAGELPESGSGLVSTFLLAFLAAIVNSYRDTVIEDEALERDE